MEDSSEELELKQLWRTIWGLAQDGHPRKELADKDIVNGPDAIREDNSA